jgi:arylsulfatase A-like enzyme
MKLFFALLSLGLALGSPLAAPATRPNFLFLLTDDQRADTLHALGKRSIQTPNLDRLVRSGTTFTQAHLMGSPQHGAVCMPSRAMLLSGRTLFRVREDLRDTDTWPEQLRRGGYRTFMTGKWHNGVASARRVFPEAAAVFFGGMSDPFAVPVADLRAGNVIHRRTETNFAAQVFADAALGFLRQQTRDEPFCLYVAFTTPHDPRSAPEEFRRRYDPAKLPLPVNFRPRHPFDNGELEVRDEKLLPWPRNAEAVRRELADYYASITATDAQIGRLLDELDRRGLTTNTVILFAGDNGLALGSHGLLGKQNLYEHSTRVPLVVTGPQVARNRRTDALCYLTDLAPTLTTLAGVAAPFGSEGQDLAPLLRGERNPKGRDVLFTAYRAAQRAVRDARWKLIEYPQAGRTQLFDLRNDPAEVRDVSAQARYQTQRQRLTALLRTQQRKLADPLAPRVEAP